MNFKPDIDQTCFVPLGGCGMFGANLSLYHHKGKWIMVDCGMAFADEGLPGVDILLPDISFVQEIKDDLIGLVITHGHDDHVGGIEHLWRQFECPIYTTPFTAEFIRQKLSEHGWASQVPIHEIECGGKLDLSPFHIQMIDMCHSIPEMQSLAITMEGTGTILHTGDWKLDDNPVEGAVTDEKALRNIGDKGVLAILGDSTNALATGHSGSEGTVKENLSVVFDDFKDKQIIVACFSSNTARIKSIALAAMESGRKVGLVGRSLWRRDSVARVTGYLSDIPIFLDEEEMVNLPPSERLYICTGSQGEPRAALTKIANGKHPRIKVKENDVVIFSALDIPGNDRSIGRIRNRLMAQDVRVITKHDAPIHVSGHPNQEEVKKLIGWVKPDMVIPVHGEEKQLRKHGQIAQEYGIEKIYIPNNGQVVLLSNAGAEQIGEVKSGLLALEGKRLVPTEHEAIQVRKRIMFHGCAVITVVINAAGHLVAEPQITAMGLVDENSTMEQKWVDDTVYTVRQTVDAMPKGLRRRDDEMSEKIRIVARRHLGKRFNRNPQTRVHLIRLEEEV